MSEKRKRKNKVEKYPVQVWFIKSAWFFGPLWIFMCAIPCLGWLVVGIYFFIMIGETLSRWNPKKGMILAMVLLMPVFYFSIFWLLFSLGSSY